MSDINDGFRGGAVGKSNANDLLGAKFSTADKDNDKSSSNCAAQSHSGWWFNNCASFNLNGLYHGSRTEKNTYDVKTGNPTHPNPPNDGIFWQHKNGKWQSLRQTKMFIAPAQVKEYPCMYNK